MNTFYTHFRHNLPLLIFTCFIFFSAYQGWKSPYYTWDVLPYVGSAYSLTVLSDSVVHKKTYSIAKATLPVGVYNEFTKSLWQGTENSTDIMGSYHANMAQNPSDFAQQFPFYKVKPLYVGFLYLAILVNINPFYAAVMISIIASVFIAFLLFYWLSKYMSAWWAVLWSIGLLLAAAFQDIIAMTTPDIFSAAFILLGFYFFVEKGSFNRAFVCLLASTFVRGDNFLIVFLFLILEKFFAGKKISWNTFIISSAFVFSLLISIEYSAHAYSWKTLFYHTFIHTIDQPLVYHPAVTVGLYLDTFIHGLRMKPPSNVGFFFLMLAAFAFVFHRSIFSKDKNRMLHAFHVILAYIFLRFCIFPSFSPRFFFVYYLIIGVYFVAEAGMVIGGYSNIELLPSSEFIKRILPNADKPKISLQRRH